MSVVRRAALPAMFLAAAIVVFFGVSAFRADAQATGEAGVAEAPRVDTLQVIDGEVFDSAVIGNRVIVVGTFTQVRNPGGATIDQPYIAAYNADTGQFDGSFRPDVDDFVNAVTVGPANAVFIGGQFNTVGGEAHRKIAKLNANGEVNSAFRVAVDATVNVVEVAHGKVYFGGRFTAVNGQARTSLAAVDVNSGAVDSATDFDFSFSNQAGGGVAVRWLDISSDGSFMFVSHGARFIDGEIRSGVARFDLTANSTTLNNWQTLLYDNELDRLGGVLRIRRLAVAPNGEYVVIVTSGGDRPPAGDTAVRFSTSGGANVQPDWISRHFDTVLGVAINNDTVFVGGHFQFQEAPGSDNPFPGDPLVNFGFGQDQGPLSLGSQVVQREQLGALDPATGKSLGWNPGSDSFIGVQSLTWDDRLGLLVGHDGNRLGGVSTIGRHGIFPIGGTPTPTPTPTPNGGFSCNATFAGGSATVTFSGDLGDSLQLRRNGSWAATVTGTSATITADQGDTLTARLRGPNYANPFQDIDCTTGNGGAGGTPAGGVESITTRVIAPGNGAVVNGGTVTISGESTGPGGIRRVRLTVVRVDTGEYLRADGTYSSEWSPLDIDLNTGDEMSTWSIDVDLDFAGRYDVVARTFDASGNRDASVRRNFTVVQAASAAPELVIDAPIVRGGEVEILGSASDDVGVASVNFLIQNQDSQLYFRNDGSVGAAERFSTTLSNEGGTVTNWSRTITGLPAGQWQITADVFDDAGQRSRRARTFSQVGTAAPPEIELTSGAEQKLAPGSRFSFAGEATASVEIESVQVRVVNSLDGSGVGANGQLGRQANFFVVPGTAGGTIQSWTYTTPELAVGTYDVQFRVIDEFGSVDRVFTQVVAGPIGDAQPTATFDGENRFAQGVDSLTLNISGTAADDIGVAQVAVSVFDEQARRWLHPDGTYDSIPEPFLANLSAPGQTNTDWSLAFTAPADGTYQFHVRAVDTAGQAARFRLFGNFRAYPGDEIPTVTVTQPAAGEAIAGNRLSATGTARDDTSVTGVEVRIRNNATGEYLRADGSLGGSQWLDASLTNIGGVRTNWDLVSPVLPDGVWNVQIRSVDDNGQLSDPMITRTITIG